MTKVDKLFKILRINRERFDMAKLYIKLWLWFLLLAQIPYPFMLFIVIAHILVIFYSDELQFP